MVSHKCASSSLLTKALQAALIISSSALAGDLAFASPISAVHSEKCVEVLNSSIAHGVQIVQARCTGNLSQDWYLSDAGNGYSYIVSSYSGKCVSILNGSVAHGAQVVQANCEGRPWQKFEVDRLSDGTTRFIAANSGMCLAVLNGDQAHGAWLVQARCTYEPFHRWRL